MKSFLHSQACLFLALSALTGARMMHSSQYPPSCDPESFISALPEKFEPSDLTYDSQANLLYIVSDNGRLAAMDVDGNLKQMWKLGKEFDLEGLTRVPNRSVFD